MKFIDTVSIFKVIAHYAVGGFLVFGTVAIIPALIIAFISQNPQNFWLVCISFGFFGTVLLTFNISIRWIKNGVSGNKEINILLQDNPKQLVKNIWITNYKDSIIRVRKADADQVNYFITHMHVEVLNADDLIVKNYMWGHTHIFPAIQKIDSIQYTLVNTALSLSERVSHYFDILPSTIQSDTMTPRYILPIATIIFSFKDSDGYYLWRLTSDIEDAGDTWHPTLENLLEQAKFEFGIDEEDWKPFPNHVRNFRQWKEWVEAVLR